MKIIKNKEPIWETDKYDVILLGTSIYCMLGNGFQSKMRYKYPFLEEINNSTKYGDISKLGKRITINDKKDCPIISLLYICRYPNIKQCSLSYEALENCLATANIEFKGKKVLTTVLGGSAFDGNGDKTKILEIIEKNTFNLDIDVYDYTQLKRQDEIAEVLKKIAKEKENDIETYKELRTNRNEIIKNLYLDNK